MTITKRDLLAAQAPRDIPEWFEPRMGEKPSPDVTAFPDYKTREKLIDAWYEEREKQKLLQWPYAYADLVISSDNNKNPV